LQVGFKVYKVLKINNKNLIGLVADKKPTRSKKTLQVGFKVYKVLKINNKNLIGLE